MLGSGEDSPTSSTPGWAQGARKFDLMSGYVMCAERATGFGRAGRWEPLVRGLAVQPEEHARLPGTVLRRFLKPAVYAEGWWWASGAT